jgi:tetratricopeptide (TPR) repeat protein
MKKKQEKFSTLGVLKIIAYFAPDNIPINIFLQLVKDGELELGSILQLPKQYSMVGLEKGVLNIHRLVQQVMQLGIIEEQKEKETLRKALKLLKNTAEEASSKSIKCIPHATSVWNYASIHRELIEEFSQFPSRFIVHLRDAGRYEEACKFAVKTIQLLKDKLGQKDPSTLMTQHIMATVLRSQGQYDEAFKLNQEVYEIRKAILGHDHQDTLTSLHNMASILVKQGRYDEALKFYQEVYEKQKEIIGPDHPDTLTSQYSIIVTQLNQGHGEVLLSSFQELSEKLKEILNDDDKSSELYQVVYEKQKDLIEPIRVIPHNIIIQSKDKILGTYSISYEILKKIHGPDNLHTLKVQHCIAKLLHHQGKYEEAIKEYQEVYKKLKEVLGPVNPDTLMIQYDITSVQHHQGKYEKAIKGYQEVYEKLKAVLEPVHPNTIQVQYSMALALDKQGQYEEAYKHYQEVHEKQKEVLGPDHRDTLLTWSNLKKFMEKCPNF